VIVAVDTDGLGISLARFRAGYVDVQPSRSLLRASLLCAALSKVSSISLIRVWILRDCAPVCESELEEVLYCGPYILDSRACTLTSKGRAEADVAAMSSNDE
jgi:hypothetical protein